MRDWTASKRVPMRRFDPVTVVFLALASAWAMAQFVLAFFVHVTERAKVTRANGWWGLPRPTFSPTRRPKWCSRRLSLAWSSSLAPCYTGGGGAVTRALVSCPGACPSPLFSSASSGSLTCWASRCVCAWVARPFAGVPRQKCHGLQRRGQRFWFEADDVSLWSRLVVPVVEKTEEPVRTRLHGAVENESLPLIEPPSSQLAVHDLQPNRSVSGPVNGIQSAME
jgi:hypothetical protein